MQSWHVACVPLFFEDPAKGLLIRLIKCFVATGPTLCTTNTSSYMPPTLALYPFNIHISIRKISPFIITSKSLATFLLIGCQWLFLPVKFEGIALRVFFKITIHCTLHSQAKVIKEIQSLTNHIFLR